MLPFDGLRGLAALGVAGFHLNPVSPYLFWAWTLVDLFFVLSGFLIGSILYKGFKDNSLNLKSFWMRRILRIWPVYYLTLFTVLAMSFLHGSGAVHIIGHAIRSLFFLQFTGAYLHPGADWNGVLKTFIPFFGHSWSIATEEQFYLLLPIFLWLVGIRARSIFLLVIAALVISEALLYGGFVPGLLGTRMQGLALGLLLVPLSRWLAADQEHPASRRHYALVIIAVGAVAGLWIMVPGFLHVAPLLYSGQAVPPDLARAFSLDSVMGMSLIYFGIVGSVLAYPSSALARVLSLPPVVYLGSISYALYMFHVPVEAALMMLRGGRPPAQDTIWVQLAFWIIAIGLAHLSKVMIEDRFNALKDRYPVYNRKN